jgi:hypothetical protein
MRDASSVGAAVDKLESSNLRVYAPSIEVAFVYKTRVRIVHQASVTTLPQIRVIFLCPGLRFCAVRKVNFDKRASGHSREILCVELP